jgi:hypothetical protein
MKSTEKTPHSGAIGIGRPFRPSVWPDGTTIAFITGDKIWLIERDGGTNLRQLDPHAMKQQRPVFSQDGTKIAAVICNQGVIDSSGEVFVIYLKTKEIRPVRTNAGAALVPDTMRQPATHATQARFRHRPAAAHLQRMR